MNKEVQKIYKRKIKEFQKHNKLYYDKSTPAISDSKFDELKAEIVNLEKKYSFLASEKSPSNSVGFKPSKNFEKFKILLITMKAIKILSAESGHQCAFLIL